MSYLIFITIIVNLAIYIPFTKKGSKIRLILYIALLLTIITGIIVFTIKHFEIVLSVLGFIFLVVLVALSQDDTNTSRKSKTITNKSHQNSSQTTWNGPAPTLGYFVVIFKLRANFDVEKKLYHLPNFISFKCTSLNEIEMIKNCEIPYQFKSGVARYIYSSYYELENSREFENLEIPLTSQTSYYFR